MIQEEKVMQVVRAETGSELVRVVCPLCHSQRSAYERTVNGYLLERCGDCGFVFTNPQPSLEFLAELYSNRDANALIDFYARTASPSQLAMFDSLLERLEKLHGGVGRLLDLGCGPGYCFERAAKRGWDAHGVDLGEWTAAAAAARNLKNLHVGNLADQSFPDGHFDAVVSVEVFEHLTDPISELKDIQRVLRPGGLLLLQVPNDRTLSILLGRDDFRLNTPPQHLNYFTPHTLRKLLQENGFRVLQLRTGGGLKLENLLGRKYQSDITNATESKSLPAAGTPAWQSFTGEKPIWKRMLLPMVDSVFYRAAKVGMSLTAIARFGQGKRS